MLPQAYRLRLTADVIRVRQYGRHWRHPLMTLIIYSHPSGEADSDNAKTAEQAMQSRFGFVAGRHVGSAVRRNRVKRRLREIIRSRLEQIEPGWDFLVVARQPAAEATFAELESAMVQLLQRAGVLAVRHEVVGQEHSGKP